MNSDIRGVYRVGCGTVGDLWAAKIKTNLIGTWLQIDQSFEMRAAHRPDNRWKVIIEFRHRKRPVNAVLGWFANGPV